MADPALVPDLLRERAASRPEQAAFIVDGRSMSYGEWESRSNAMARGLVQRGVMSSEPVGLFFENSEWADYAVAYLATLKAGAIAVPLSSRFAEPEATRALDRCGAVGLVRAHGPRGNVGWTASPDDLAAGQPVEEFQVPVAPAAIAEILYTSGTTGAPKGVACAHAHMVRPLLSPGDWPPPWWRECADGVYLHANAVSTAAAQLRLLDALGPHGMTMAALPQFDPERYCRLIEEHSAAVAQLVPSMAMLLLDSGACCRHDVSSVRVVSLGCAPLPPAAAPKLAAAFPNARVVNMYEMSEARHVGAALIRDPDDPRDGSVGRPRGASEMKVSDPDGEELPVGAVGEIWVRWPGLPPQQYFGDPRATAEVFVDGWTRTGDAGYRDEDGYLYLVDRLKDVIIKAGMSVGSLEVENALRAHPAVADCAVVGVPDRVHGEEIAAAVVLREDVAFGDIRRFLRTRLADHKIPRQYLKLRELPRNRSGKVLKRELRQMLEPSASR